MLNMTNYEEERFGSWPYILTLMVIAYIFSYAIRLIWVYQMGDNPQFIWNGEIMINTNDGYYFAAAAKSVLEGTNGANPQIPGALVNYPVMVYLTAYASKFLSIPLDTIILYMPAVVSSLVVVPIILIGRLFGLPLMGFFAALIGSVAWSYYNRTMVGYYDSDMFAVLMQMFVLYSMLSLIMRHRLSDAFMAFTFIAIYPYFYPQGISLIYGMYFLYIAYAFFFLRKYEPVYFGIAAIAIALTTLPLWGKIILLGFAWWLFKSTFLTLKYRVVASVAFLGLFLIEANVFGLIFEKISGYLNRGTEEHGLHFYQVIQTVREAGQIPFSTMANRISGSTPGVIAAMIGYVLMVMRKKEMIIALPLIGIGVFSLWGGLRFTVYAVPIAALSVVFLFYMVASYINISKLRYVVVAVLTAAMLYPNIMHIEGYRVPTVFTQNEVASLNQLSKRGSDKDYVLTWWDYGYPIWYYGNKNTLIDGSKHHHDNFIISEMLTTDSQLEAARLARIAVETYVASGYKTVADTLFKNKQPDQLDPNAYLENLRYGDVTLPKATRDVYLFLPLRMLDIFPTVAVFSNLDLNTGQKYRQPFFFATSQFQDSAQALNLGRGIILDKRTGTVQLGQQRVPLKSFDTVTLKPDGSMDVKSSLLSMNGALTLVFMPNYRKFLLLDDKMLNSTYVQMFVYGKYDPALFEPVELTPMVKIYKVKL
jgi:undecaprenyl-diphosphooligosaccharide--protein glycosyltransferase